MNLLQVLFQNYHQANTEVPADTLPVRCLTLLVAAIPVPASPSGGQTGIPALQRCRIRIQLLCTFFCQDCRLFHLLARTFGRISLSFHGKSFVCNQLHRTSVPLSHRNLCCWSQSGTYQMHRLHPDIFSPVSCQ